MTYERPTLKFQFLSKDDILSRSDDSQVGFEGLSPDGSGIGDIVDFSDIYKNK